MKHSAMEVLKCHNAMNSRAYLRWNRSTLEVVGCENLKSLVPGWRTGLPPTRTQAWSECAQLE